MRGANTAGNEPLWQVRMMLHQAPLKGLSAAAVRIIEYQSVSAANDQRVAPDAQRSPDFARTLELAPQRSNILIIFMPMKLHRGQVQNSRNVRNDPARSIAEHSDRPKSIIERKTSQLLR